MSIHALLYAGLLLALTTAIADPDPSGSWKMTMPGPDGTELVVLLTLDNGKYQGDLGNDGQIDVSGTYTLNGDQITLQDDPTNSTNPCEEPGTYTITIDGDQMTMTLESDTCNRRSEVLNGVSMSRQ